MNTMNEKSLRILFEAGDFYVCDGGKWFEVYENGFTHAKRRAQIGYGLGLERAIRECKRLAAIKQTMKNP